MEYHSRRMNEWLLVIVEIKHKFKEIDEWMSRMCEIIEKYKAEGREEGREEERYEIITNMLRNGMNIDMFAKIVKMKVEQVIAIGKKAAVL